MSGSTQCPHSDLHLHTNIASFGNTNIRYVEVSGNCKVCGEPMRFRGMPLGVTPTQPTMALDGSEARLPMLFGDEEYDGNAFGFTGGVA